MMTTDIPESRAISPEWASRPITHLIAHLIDQYRAATQERIEVISERLAGRPFWTDGSLDVAIAYNSILNVFTMLAQKAHTHMLLEDVVLFPVVMAAEHPEVITSRRSRDEIERLIARVADEHRQIRRLVRELTDAVSAFASQAGSESHEAFRLAGDLTTFATLLKGQIALEDGNLWPRALELIRAAGRREADDIH